MNDVCDDEFDGEVKDNSTLKKLPLHCSDLSKLMFEAAKYPWGFLYRPAEWLNIASGIDKVECYTGRFSDCWMCSSVDEYDDKRDELLSIIITELTRFSFIWNSFELLMENFACEKYISKSSVKKKRKVNVACSYLKNRYINSAPLPYYYETLNSLEKLIKSSGNYKDVLEKFSPNPEWISQAGMGLYTVSKIRNKFAHGSHAFPEPEDYSEEKPLDREIIENSSRILLLSMQMLLIACHKDKETMIDCWWDHSIPDDENGGRELEIKAYLKEIHLEKESAY